MIKKGAGLQKMVLTTNLKFFVPIVFLIQFFLCHRVEFLKYTTLS